MTNQGTHTISKNNKYGLKKTDENYFKNKNQKYYLEIKSDPVKSKASLIYYYKRKFGEQIVANILDELGLELALIKLKSMCSPRKKSLKKPTLECY